MSQASTKTLSGNATLWLGGLTISAGLMLVGVAFDWLPTDPASIHAPRWVLAAAGLVFAFAGLAMMLRDYPRWVAFFAGCLCLSMMSVAIWATFIAEPDKMQGGIPFAPRGVNVWIGRVLMGFGVLLSGGMAYAAFRAASRPSKPRG